MMHGNMNIKFTVGDVYKNVSSNGEFLEHLLSEGRTLLIDVRSFLSILPIFFSICLKIVISDLYVVQ
jgi:hypothetical protein